MKNETETPTQALTPEEKIKNGLAKNNLAEQAIEQLKEDYKDLKVTDIDDVAGHETVRKARIKVRDVRLGIEKYCDAAGRGAYEYYKACLSEKKRYLGMITPLEERLQLEEGFIAREKEKIRIETEEKELIRRQTRVKRLVALGMIFNGVDIYSIVSDTDSVSIDQASINHMNDEQFEIYALKAQELSYEIKAKKKQEEERIASIEAEQLKERDRLQAIAQENAKKEQALLAKEKELLAAEQKKALERYDLRVGRLTDLGMTYDVSKGIFHYQNLTNIRGVDVTTMEDDAFKGLIETARTDIAKIKADAEKKRLQDIEEAKKQAVIDANRKKLADAEQAKKKEMRKSDKARLVTFAQSLSEIDLPEGLKSTEAQTIITEAQRQLSAVSAYIVNQSNNL